MFALFERLVSFLVDKRSQYIEHQVIEGETRVVLHDDSIALGVSAKKGGK